jgi:16S rRNA processing protein RimM
VKWDDLALVGRVARTHGVRGHVFVDVETDFPHERFLPGAELFVNRGGAVTGLTLTTVRFQLDRPVVGFEGIETMTAAQELAGLELRVPMSALVKLPPGSFYRHDLVGCVVVTSEGARIGVVQDVEGTMGGSCLVVGTGNGEVLVPLAADICTGIDVEARRVVIQPPEGLLELNDRRA